MEAAAHFTDIAQLPLRERVRLFEKLWDSFAVQPNDITVPDWHKATLQNRLHKYQKTAKTGNNWSTVKQQLETQF